MMASRRTFNIVATGLVAAAQLLTAGVVAGLSGCEREEPLFEMKTPDVEIEVRKSDEGRAEVEVQTGEDAADTPRSERP